jgi:hypothetical protein
MRFRPAILIFGVALCSACSRTPASAAPDAASYPQATLQSIPAADPSVLAKIDVHVWKNPYLIIKPDTVALLDVADHEEKKLRPEELADALAKLPQSAWPYGRVVAVTINDTQASEDDKVQLRKNRALVAGTLKDLQIYVNWVPWA